MKNSRQKKPQQANQAQTIPVSAAAPWKGMFLLPEDEKSVCLGLLTRTGLLPGHFEMSHLTHLIISAALRPVQFVSRQAGKSTYAASILLQWHIIPLSLSFSQLPGEFDPSVVENSCFGDLWEAPTCLHGRWKTHGSFSPMLDAGIVCGLLLGLMQLRATEQFGGTDVL